MTVRFSVTVELHDVPTVRHVRDIEESLRGYARRLVCRASDTVAVHAERVDRKGPGREEFVVDTSLEQIA
ncbi:MAG TPA: hypothetical protein VN579_07300 [Bryobacteraceae bacterium]|nr:hypothetical protein [Bryobacteraceae bacterium]